jgi:hypothetical protein
VRVSLLLASVRKDISRTSYTVFAILGEVGGITSIFIFIFELITKPVAHHCVFMKYLSKLFLVKLSDNNFFVSYQKKEKYI